MKIFLRALFLVVLSSNIFAQTTPVAFSPEETVIVDVVLEGIDK